MTDSFPHPDDRFEAGAPHLTRRAKNLLVRAYRRVLKSAHDALRESIPNARDAAKDIALEFMKKEYDDRLKHLRGRDDRAIRAFCFQRGQSRARDLIRRLKTRREQRLPEDDDALDAMSPAVPAPDDIPEEDPNHVLVREALGGLSSREREVAALRLVDGLSYQDIALLLDIEQATARVLAKRATDKLTKRLAPLAQGRIKPKKGKEKRDGEVAND